MSGDEKQPWQIAPLNEWAIVGMNHCHVAGEKRLFVAMTKGTHCITAEGADDKYIWNRLWRMACDMDSAELGKGQG